MGFKINEIDKLILRDLYNSVDGLYTITFFNRYRLKAKNVFEFILKYKNNGIINYDDNKLSLTSEGRKKIFSDIFFHKKKSGLTSNLPSDYFGYKIDKSYFYLPIISYIGDDL